MDTILIYSMYLFSKGVKGVLCLPRSSKHPKWLVWDAYRMLDTHCRCDGDGDGANLKATYDFVRVEARPGACVVLVHII